MTKLPLIYKQNMLFLPPHDERNYSQLKLRIEFSSPIIIPLQRVGYISHAVHVMKKIQDRSCIAYDARHEKKIRNKLTKDETV